MAISLTHTTAADGTFSGDGATAWDEAHTLTMATARMLGRTTASAGAVEEIEVGSNLTLSDGVLDIAVPLSLDNGTITTSAPILDLSQTWNDGAVTFTGLKLNVTDTASAADSLLLDLQVGGLSKASITKSGMFKALNQFSGPTFANIEDPANGISTYAAFGLVVHSASGGTIMAAGYSALRMGSSSSIGWMDGENVVTASNYDLNLTRKAAHNLQLGAADAGAPSAQKLSVQSVVAGTTDTAGTDFSIYGSAGTGTGAGGSIKFYTSPAGASGTSQNAGALALTIDSTKLVTFDNVAGWTTVSGGYGGRLLNSTFSMVGAGDNTIGLSYNGIISIYNAGFFAFSDADAVAGDLDTRLYRDAPYTLALRNGTNAQTSRVYGTYTDASNYRRVSMSMTTAGVATLLPEGAGSGASGNVIHISGLPTSNPGPGILWNNAGTPAIGT